METIFDNCPICKGIYQRTNTYIWNIGPIPCDECTTIIQVENRRKLEADPELEKRLREEYNALFEEKDAI